jgi:hypothetical protein
VEKYFKALHVTDFNMAPAHCILDILVQKHTIRICNTYRFSTATVIKLAHPILGYNYIVSFVTKTEYYYSEDKGSKQIWRLSATSERRREISPTQICLCQGLEA